MCHVELLPAVQYAFQNFLLTGEVVVEAAENKGYSQKQVPVWN